MSRFFKASRQVSVFSFASSLVAAAVLTACGGGSSTPVTSADKAVSITFAAVNGTTPVTCGTTLTGIGGTGASANVQDLRFYITNLALINDKGVAVPVKLDANKWQLTQTFSQGTETVSLIDLENATGACATGGTAETNAVITGTVPAGNYVGLKATVGVPENLNHTAVSGGTPPLDNTAMNWSWQSGRKFTKIELNPVGGITKTVAATATTAAVVSNIPTFNLHLGSTGCTAKAGTTDAYVCTSLNVADFNLATFNADTQKVALDIGQLFKTTNITVENGGAAGCMSGATDPECPALFAELGIPLGTNGATTQRVFKAIAK